MVVVRRCPICGDVVATANAACSHCGHRPQTTKVVTFNHAARWQGTATTSSTDGIAGSSGDDGAGGISRSTPIPTHASFDESYDPRVLLTFLIVALPVAVIMTFARGAPAEGFDMACEVLCRAVIVGVQYSVLWRLSSERSFALVMALLVAASISPAQPDAQHRRLFAANLVLMVAGVQALGLASVRLWRSPRPHQLAPDPERSSLENPDCSPTTSGCAPAFESLEKGRPYADHAV